MNKKMALSAQQRNILILCMIGYSVLYFMRLNLTLALPGMRDELLFSPAQLGTIASAFFWFYAVGQLINGWIGDRLPVRWMVFIGLLGSGILNLFLSVSTGYAPIVACWAVNGIFQSMLWSPMVKCISQYFDREKRILALFAMSLTQVLGYMITWSASYEIERLIGWRFVFRLPAFLGIAFSAVWVVLFRYESKAEKKNSVRKGDTLFRRPALLGYLALIAVFSVVLGLAKSSMETWLPTMLQDLGNLSSSAVFVTLLLIPLLNFGGIMLAKLFVKRLNGHIYKAILILWGAATVFGAVTAVTFRVSPLIAVFSSALLFGLVYAQTPLFTSFIPIDFVKWNCVSTITGFVDFAIYIGAAVTGVVSGEVLGNDYRWQNLGLYWCAVLLVGLALAVIVCFRHKKLIALINREEKEWD